ncbi:hypothetical protein HMPREF9138_01090 [Prevotella histicola F0411]|uniref:Uncharacterized protein n=1 Tax=Prevotella histicola F0411 TaxID=857291 RepID=G6AG63_9BACT|nr:hypothetical protein HMPREF9138_01090 [Prevotella histicola F0411]
MQIGIFNKGHLFATVDFKRAVASKYLQSFQISSIYTTIWINDTLL